MKMRASSLFAALSMALAMPAFALKSDRDKPMDIRSDSGTANANEGTATLSGNVHITQGTLEIRAAKAVVTQNDKQEVARNIQIVQDLRDNIVPGAPLKVAPGARPVTPKVKKQSSCPPCPAPG